jgi:hypothetical protein
MSGSTRTADGESGGGAAIYANFIAEQLKQQEATRVSLDGRATSVIGGAATLSTLLLGLAAFGRGAAGVELGRASSVFVAGAVIVFAIAAILALRSFSPRAGYPGATAASLRDGLEKYWDDSSSEALRMIAHTQVTALDTAKTTNDWKARRLAEAISFEVGAAVVLAIGVVLVLLGM